MMSDHQDREFEAIRVIYEALEPLDDDARTRIVNYIVDRLDISIEGDDEDDIPEVTAEAVAALDQEQESAPKFATFAELFDAARPVSNPQKALVAGYWLQVCQGQDDFDGQSANRELKNLGEGIPNITLAMNGLKAQKPALAIQLKKSGKSQQARKTYKITVAGIRAVEEMIGK